MPPYGPCVWLLPQQVAAELRSLIFHTAFIPIAASFWSKATYTSLFFLIICRGRLHGINSIKDGNIHNFSPHFHLLKNLWKLGEERFNYNEVLKSVVYLHCGQVPEQVLYSSCSWDSKNNSFLYLTFQNMKNKEVAPLSIRDGNISQEIVPLAMKRKMEKGLNYLIYKLRLCMSIHE